MDANQCNGDSSGGSGSGSNGRLSLFDMWTVFLIPAAGTVLAAIVLAAEILYYRKCYSGTCGRVVVTGCLCLEGSKGGDRLTILPLSRPRSHPPTHLPIQPPPTLLSSPLIAQVLSS